MLTGLRTTRSDTPTNGSRKRGGACRQVWILSLPTPRRKGGASQARDGQMRHLNLLSRWNPGPGCAIIGAFWWVR